MNIRIIARLDIKGPNLIKAVQLEGVRVVGSPQEYARRYYEAGIDEVIYMDAVASLYGRNNLSAIVEETTKNLFIPVTVGGGIRALEDVTRLLRAGADKVAINTAATQNPSLITEVARAYGSQCMVLSIEAKRKTSGGWEAYTDNGRMHTGLDVVEWAKKGVECGAGEILLTSVDQEGTRKGFDLELLSAVSSAVPVPVIASGGMGTLEHFKDAVRIGKADAVAIADMLHYNRITVSGVRAFAEASEIPVRKAAREALA